LNHVVSDDPLHMERSLLCLVLGGISLLMSGPLFAAEKTSENDARLKRGLARYPAADTNRDGVLTMSEATAYQRKRGQGKAPKSTKGSQPTPAHADLHYGPHERNRLDLWLAKSEEPTPLLICIHGGGFSGGDKRSYRNNSIVSKMLAAGISVATINYRLTDGGRNPYPIPMHDSARALQYLRHHANKFNLDPARVASTGGSAGACISMWLAFHDDLADLKSEDPILRESTRLTAIAPNSGQPTVHMPTFLKWFGVDSLVEHAGGRPLFGIPAGGELKLSPELDALMLDASPITHLTKDDPPVYMVYGRPDTPVSETTKSGVWVHHPRLGVELKKAMDQLGLPCELQYPGGPKVATYKDQTEFLIRNLTGQ
jgi:acetyl esterase/lipase